MPLSKWLVAGAVLLPLAAGAQTPGPQHPADPQAAVPALPDASLFPRYQAAVDAPGTPDRNWRQANREAVVQDDAMAGMPHDMPGMQHDKKMPGMPGMDHDMTGMMHTAPAPVPHGTPPSMPEMPGMAHSPSAGHSHAGGH